MNKRLLIVFLFFNLSGTQAQPTKINLVVGTYTNSCSSSGIYVYEFDSHNAQLRLKKVSDSLANPSYLSLSKDQKFVYAVNESGSKSTVSALSFDAQSGKTRLINRQDAKGADPCYLINDDNHIIVANYSSGNIAVFPKNPDGSIGEAKQLVQHYGSGKNVQRQQKPHVHMVFFSPDKKFVLSNDLGNDKLYVYKYDPKAAQAVLSLKDSVAVRAGSGPRHLSFSHNGKWVYLLQELDGRLTSFRYEDGVLVQVGETSVVDSAFKGAISAADIHISPNGRFLYATNRGDANTISVFRILSKGKKLRFLSQQSTLGRGPRNFAIDPSGSFLLVAHQYSNNIVVFKINKRNGSLSDTSKRVDICAPVCLQFAQ